MIRPESDAGQSRRPDPTSAYWDSYARKANKGRFQERIAVHKRDVHLSLIRAWAPGLERSRLLKTDANEEAFGADAILDALAAGAPLATGMDISREIAGLAKKRFPALSFAAADTRFLPYRASAFDVVVSNSTLDHLVLRDVPIALRELARVLKPGGILILTLDNRHNPLHVFSHRMRRICGWFYTDRCYTVSEARTLLEENGFQTLESTAIFHIPFPLNFLSKAAERLFGPRVNAPVEGLVRFFGRLENFPTRFLTGRHIALKAMKPAPGG